MMRALAPEGSRPVAQAFDLAGITNTVGALSFALLAKGGNRNACAKDGQVTPATPETKSPPRRHPFLPLLRNKCHASSYRAYFCVFIPGATRILLFSRSTTRAGRMNHVFFSST